MCVCENVTKKLSIYIHTYIHMRASGNVMDYKKQGEERLRSMYACVHTYVCMYVCMYVYISLYFSGNIMDYKEQGEERLRELYKDQKDKTYTVVRPGMYVCMYVCTSTYM